MSRFREITTLVRQAFSSDVDQSTQEDRRFMRPFLWMVLIGMVFMYALSVYFQEVLHEPGRLTIFTILILVHVFLHFILLRNSTLSRPLLISYIIVQGVLAYLMVYIAQTVSLSYGLYFALIGETVGMLWMSKMGIFSLLFNLLFSALSYLLVEELSSLWLWALSAFPFVALLLLYLFVFRRQIAASERYKALLEDLETAHHQLAEYAARVEDLTITNERQRMARELHDTLSQGLAGLILQLEAVSAHLQGKNHKKADTVLSQAMGRARQTLADARRAIGDLRSTAPLNLAEAIQAEVEQFKSLTSIPCTLEIAILPDLPESVREHALKAITEALTNIARHAQAGQAWLRVAVQDACLLVEIRDDGVGFDPSAAVGKVGHFGLLGVRERLRLAGGSLDIHSAPGKGSSLSFRLPLAEKSTEGK